MAGCGISSKQERICRCELETANQEVSTVASTELTNQDRRGQNSYRREAGLVKIACESGRDWLGFI